jgi:D-alanyl-D-alanine carboxypeptidase (penicillin-binding protein 5/6)
MVFRSRRARHSSQYYFKKQPKRWRGKAFVWTLLIIMAGCVVSYLRPLPTLAVSKTVSQQSTATTGSIAWPTDSVAAIGAEGYGVLASSKGNNTPVPTASIAKIITVLAVLKQKPLAQGTQGPTLVMTQADVDSYWNYVNQDGSVAKVEVGEQITQYQALEAVLIPSANNMADTMAKWAFGSLDAYRAYATSYIKQLGLTNTTVGIDASGLSPTTTSTPSDLVKLGAIAMQNPVIAEIVNKPSATIPVAGTVYNSNKLLGVNGVNGIKTGNSDEARGCVLVSAVHEVAPGKTVTIIVAVLGAPTLRAALAEGQALIAAAKPHFSIDQVVQSGQAFGDLYIPWEPNSAAHAVAAYAGSAITWDHSVSPITVNMHKIRSSITKGSVVGSANLRVGSSTVSIPLIIDRSVSAPSFWWRVIRW